METDLLIKKRRRQFFLNLTLTLVGIGTIPAAYRYFKDYLSGDPFSSVFAKTSNEIDDSIGIRMDGVELRDYSGAKLISSAYANRVDVRRDRQSVTLYGVSRGEYSSEKGKVTYSATQAIWSFQTKQVDVTKSVDVQGKDFDLHSNRFNYDDRLGLVKITGAVTGKLFNGSVSADTISYNLNTKAADVGPFSWTGEVNLSDQVDNKVTPRKWTIRGAHMHALGAGSDKYVYQKATATDGELIINAPEIEQDRKTDVLTATGGIEYYSAKSDILADKCVIYRKEKRAVLSGHVVMYVKPKSQENDPPKEEKLPEFKPVAPDKVVTKHASEPVDKDTQKSMEDEIRSSKNLREFPMVVVSDKIEYWYAKGSRHAIITGEPQGRQTLKGDEWRHLWTHEAFYNGETDKLKLVSTPKTKNTLMKNSIGDILHVIDMEVSTKEGDDQMDCTEPDGQITTVDDEIPRDDKKKGDDRGGIPPPTKGKGGGSSTKPYSAV